MLKNKPGRNKKAAEIKDNQKISTFFKKLDSKKSTDKKDNDFQVEKNYSEEKTSEQRIITKTGTNKTDDVQNKKKTTERNNLEEAKSINNYNILKSHKLSILLNDSDEDFVSGHLDKKTSNKNVNNIKISNGNLKKSSELKIVSNKKEIDKNDIVKNKKKLYENSQVIKSLEDDIIKEALNLPEDKNPRKLNGNEVKSTNTFKRFTVSENKNKLYEDNHALKSVEEDIIKETLNLPEDKNPRKLNGKEINRTNIFKNFTVSENKKKLNEDNQALKSLEEDSIKESLNLPEDKNPRKLNGKEIKSTNTSKFCTISENENKKEIHKKVEEEILEKVLKLPDEICIINKEQKTTENKLYSNGSPTHKNIDANNESNLIVNLDTINITKNNEKVNISVVVTPEKSYLKRDEILNDVTNIKAFDSLVENIQFTKSNRKSSPPHSTPIANTKKRKSPDTDIIPPTPEEERKPNSKICLGKKFNFQTKLIENTVVPDMIVQSPPKKVRKIINEPKKIVNLADLTEKEFEKLHATNFKNPVEEVISIHEDSLFDDFHPNKITNYNKERESNKTVNQIKLIDNVHSESDKNITIESPSLLKCPINTEKKNNSPSKWSSILKSTCNQISPLKRRNTSSNILSPAKSTNTLLEYFQNLPSEEKNKIEIDTSNFILTKKSPVKNVANESVIEDLNFDDSWDGQINDITINDLNLESWQYCKILEISSDLYQNIILKVQSLKNLQTSSVILQGMWRNTQLKKDDKINIIATKKTEQNIPYFVNNESGFIVYEPDFLISGTSIVGSLFCKRKGVLSDKFRGFEPENQVMIVGSLVHRLLQETLKRKLSKISEIEKLLMEILSGKDIVFSSYASEVPIEVIKQQTMPFITRISDFVINYVQSLNKRKDGNNWSGNIETIQDIEENIWCYNLGIKGKVDVTVKTKGAKSKQFNAFKMSDNKSIILPLELKTGRASFSLEHRGQVILYTMIMTELGYDVNSGLLLYLREGVLEEIEAKHQEKRDLIMLRNELAYYLKQQPKLPKEKSISSKTSSKMSVLSEDHPLRQLNFSELPEPINHHSACKKCAYATICTTFLSRDEKIDISDTHPLKNLSKELLSHLSQSHIDYFIHWASLIHIESSYKSHIKELKDIWRLAPIEREILGKSLSYLQISEPVIEKIEPFMHHFKRSDKSVDDRLKNDFLCSGLAVGNYAVVSTDTRVAIAAGFISKITKTEITIGLERNLFERYKNKIFHIDTYESQTIFNYSLTNIATLLVDTEKAKRLRELIIDKKQPEFTNKLSRSIAITGRVNLKRLNEKQQRAIFKVLTSQDYLLIKGMPGTGKTATIVALIQFLVDLKKTVLITSHTNSAVDNVCLRLLNCGVDVLRLGSESRIHPLVKYCSERAKTSHCKTVIELENVYNKAQVIAVTCLGANHPLLSKRTLDVCVVDESTQVLQCSIFKALQSTKTFVLIGDPEQLPPIVSNPDAVIRGMNESLFERLHTTENTITLTLQYRMNKTITALANNLTYNGQLLCADDSIGYAILRLPKIERVQTIYHSEAWILSVLDTHVENAVVCIDTGPTWKKICRNEEIDVLEDLKVPVQNVQEDEERLFENIYEAAIIVTLIEALKEGGVHSDAIGVIAPYRSQVTQLKKIISKIDEKYQSKEMIEVNTVDQYQGRDKELIIYSCTKSKDISKFKMKTNFEILEDKRRLTVAITRAKHKLIIIGDFCTLKTYSPFEILLNSLEPHQVLPISYESKGFSWEKVMEKLKNYDI